MLPAPLLLWLLSAYNSATKVTESTISAVQKIYRALYGAFIPDSYIFFHDIVEAYPEERINTAASTSAIPLWRYLSETKQFVAWSVTSLEAAQMSHSLPILSMDIYEGDETVYDLTDFIEKIRVYNDTMQPISPSVAHIVSAWSLSSGIVLNPAREFKIRYMTPDADTVETDLHYNCLINSCEAEPVMEPVVEPAADESENVDKTD
jgi:hypothetical protein